MKIEKIVMFKDGGTIAIRFSINDTFGLIRIPIDNSNRLKRQWKEMTFRETKERTMSSSNADIPLKNNSLGITKEIFKQAMEDFKTEDYIKLKTTILSLIETNF